MLLQALDPLLTDALFNSAPTGGYPPVLSKDQIFSRLFTQLNTHTILQKVNGDMELISGQLVPIQVEEAKIKKRAGSFATVITNLPVSIIVVCPPSVVCV